jgi:hypothetical protein
MPDASSLRRQLLDLPVEPGKVSFPHGVVRREFCQAHHDCLALPQCFERLRAVAGLPVNGRAKADQEIALPARVTGVGFREARNDFMPGLIGLQRRAEIPLRHLNVADPLIAYPDIILPARVAGVGFPEAVENGEAVGIRFQRLGRVALHHMHVADLDEQK